MKLEHFNRYQKFIEFDLDNGIAHELLDLDDRPVRGLADWLGSSFVALTVENGKIRIHVDETKFLVRDGLPEIQYFHNNDGTTTCAIQDQINTVQLTYGSWWLSSEETVPALGIADDEDEDLCAYLRSMTGTEQRLRHLAQKYSR